MNPSCAMVTPEEAVLWAALRQVVDPELGCNIVDLGLVYGVRVAGGTAVVVMTLTTRGCPMQESLVDGVREVLLASARLRAVEVEVVWDPPWTPDRMTPEGRALTGCGGG